MATATSHRPASASAARPLLTAEQLNALTTALHIVRNTVHPGATVGAAEPKTQAPVLDP